MLLVTISFGSIILSLEYSKRSFLAKDTSGKTVRGQH